jgi:sensor domain CHASE-containing protein
MVLYQKLDGNTFLNSEQIELLSKNYDKKVAKETQKQLREDTKKQTEKEERQRVFDF